MLIYSQIDFARIKIRGKTSKTIAGQFYNLIEKYWDKNIPKHPLYKKKIPLDGGYWDAHIAILRYFLECSEFQKSEDCIFYINRLLVCFELDPPLEFIDAQGLLINHYCKGDQKELINEIFLNGGLLATLCEMVNILNKTNKFEKDIYEIRVDEEKRKKRQTTYDSLVFVCPRKTTHEIIETKKNLVANFSNELQNNLKELFVMIAENKFSIDISESQFSQLIKLVNQLTQDNLNASHPLLRQTAMSFAIECELPKVVEILLPVTYVNLPDETGRYLIHYAVKTGNDKICELLINAKADVNVFDRDGWSPLHYAVRFLYEAMRIQSGDFKNKALYEVGLKNLIILLNKSQKIMINHQDRKGRTALHYAVVFGLKEEVIQALKIRNCRDDVKDKAGLLPKELNLMVYQYGSVLRKEFRSQVAQEKNVENSKQALESEANNLKQEDDQVQNETEEANPNIGTAEKKQSNKKQNTSSFFVAEGDLGSTGNPDESFKPT